MTGKQVLAIGQQIGPYSIQFLIGAGGMGEVYRARDPRLQRDVAIKVLAHAGSDPIRRRRFTDEAQAASALNHPSIVTVYDVGSHDGLPYIVTELIEGQSLRAIVDRGALPVRDLMDLSVQMADGLSAAHQGGIVHRDFKPENVMLTRDGRVKIVDFGLARTGVGEQMAAPPATMTLTSVGSVVGTVPYMSPEQAKGAAVDYRTDQFSLGVVLYEMATGRRAFGGETAAQVLAAILDDEPTPIGELNPRVPAPLRWVIERCLAKDARQRYEATGDLARDLRMLKDRLIEFAPSTETASAASRSRRLRLGAALIGAVTATIAATGLVVLMWADSSRRGPDLSGYRLTPIATDAGYQGSPAWSPDGRTLAYVADVDAVQQVFTRRLNSSMRAQLTRAHFDCSAPFWSPDGTRLYFLSLARDREGLWVISAAGGEPELVLENVRSAALSPDGKTLAFFRGAGEDYYGDYQQLWFSSPPGSRPVQYKQLPFGAHRGFLSTRLHFSPDGSKLGAWVEPYLEQGSLRPEFWVLPLGNAPPYVAPSPSTDLPSFAAEFSWFPDNHRIVSALPLPRPGIHLWLTDTERRIDGRLLTMTGSIENEPAISPDGSRLALSLQQVDYDLYQMTTDHPSPSNVLATSANEMDPAWSLSVAEMAFTTDRTGHEEIWLRSQRGDWERPIVTPDDFGGSPTYYLDSPAFSPDGQRIAFTRLGDSSQIWISPVAGGPPVRLSEGLQWEESPSWSPDGARIAYIQRNSRQWSLETMRVGTRTPSATVAADIAPMSHVDWSPDGQWIAYNSRQGLAIVSPDGLTSRVIHEQTWMGFAWSADSARVYGIRQSDDYRHLTFASIDIRTGSEHVLKADFMPLPISSQPVRGITRVSPTTFLTAVSHVRSDVWLLEGFDAMPTIWGRLSSALHLRR